MLKKMMLLLCLVLTDLKGETPMKKIVFEPQAWHDLEFNWNEYVWSKSENPCSPDIGISKMNALSMNVPEKIRVGKKGGAKIPVPVCVSFWLTEYRACKYSEPEHKKMIHVKSLGETESACFLHYPIERVVKYNGDGIQEVLAVNPLQADAEKERLEMIQKCKHLPDEMLDEGQVMGGDLTFNLSDYMDEPLSCGKYEIYFTYCGLESERRIVEIAYEE